MNVGIILGKNRNNSLVVAEYELYEFEKEKKDTTSELDSKNEQVKVSIQICTKSIIV